MTKLTAGKSNSRDDRTLKNREQQITGGGTQLLRAKWTQYS